jgi:hypothetical protein
MVKRKGYELEAFGLQNFEVVKTSIPVSGAGAKVVTGSMRWTDTYDIFFLV